MGLLSGSQACHTRSSDEISTCWGTHSSYLGLRPVVAHRTCFNGTLVDVACRGNVTGNEALAQLTTLVAAVFHAIFNGRQVDYSLYNPGWLCHGGTTFLIMRGYDLGRIWVFGSMVGQ